MTIACPAVATFPVSGRQSPVNANRTHPPAPCRAPGEAALRRAVSDPHVLAPHASSGPLDLGFPTRFKTYV